MEIKRKQLRKTSTEIGVILTAILSMTFIFNNIAFGIAAEFAPHIAHEPWFALTVNAVGLYVIGYAIYNALMKRVSGYKGEDEADEFAMSAELENEDDKIKRYSFVEMIMLIFISLSFLYVSNIITIAINALIAYIKGTEIVNPLMSVINSSSLIYIFIFVCILGPIVEELMFRKILLNKLLPFGKKLAIVVSAFAFGLFHGNLSQILYAYVLGLVLAYITINTGTIKYSIILHIVINTLGSLVFPSLALSGDETMIAISGLVLILFIITGIVLFITKRKILFPKLEEEIDTKEQGAMNVSTSLLSAGMIVFWVAVSALVIARSFIFNF